MSDAIKSNLEPIEEGDLNLKEKFIGGGEATEEKKSPDAPPLEDKPEIKEKKEGAVEKDAAYSRILSKFAAVASKADPGSVSKDAEDANAGIDAESKINNLVQIAQTKGVAHAVDVARHMEDNYTLDEFHDRLLGDELHDALVKKGLIKEL